MCLHTCIFHLLLITIIIIITTFLPSSSSSSSPSPNHHHHLPLIIIITFLSSSSSSSSPPSSHHHHHLPLIIITSFLFCPMISWLTHCLPWNVFPVLCASCLWIATTEWTCDQCTLINNGMHQICLACESPRSYRTWPMTWHDVTTWHYVTWRDMTWHKRWH